MPMETIDGATAFVTGGAQGIGLGIAEALQARGARVAVVDLDVGALEVARDVLGDDGTAYLSLDVRDRTAFARAADEVEDALGPVTILCNNAGIAGAFSLTEMSYELWDLVLGINVGGVVNGYQTFLPRMLDRGAPAHIVNTAAGAGLAVAGGVTGYMYQTSKYAVVGLSESTRLQLRQAGSPVGVTVLCPGPVATNIVDTTFAKLPREVLEVSDEERPARDAAVDVMRAYLASGASPRTVGDQVVEAILGDRQYVHTDRTMWDGIWQRTKELLAAMPAIPAPSTAALPSAERRARIDA